MVGLCLEITLHFLTRASIFGKTRRIGSTGDLEDQQIPQRITAARNETHYIIVIHVALAIAECDQQHYKNDKHYDIAVRQTAAQTAIFVLLNWLLVAVTLWNLISLLML